jgi:hypothetical protein
VESCRAGWDEAQVFFPLAHSAPANQNQSGKILFEKLRIARNKHFIPVPNQDQFLITTFSNPSEDYGRE